MATPRVVEYCILCRLNAARDVCPDAELRDGFEHHWWDAIAARLKGGEASEHEQWNILDHIDDYGLQGDAQNTSAQLLSAIIEGRVNPKDHIRKKIPHLSH